MINRRQFLLYSLATLLLPKLVTANAKTEIKLSWPVFQLKMKELASAHDTISRARLAKTGLQALQQLDIQSSTFKQAVNNAYESGNRYWLWQRLIKQQQVNGGILNIDRSHIVQLHDHPGATGMVRIISGEAEVWQYDEVNTKQGMATLKRVSRRILRSGDMAVLSPNKGNIHALKSISNECRMLDFFIPPYQRSERSWFEPTTKNWFEQQTILCKKIPQYAFTQA